ncbi:MAG: polyphosphate kinase 1 [Acidobacteria bacterium]|nr:polyphosphate kinase 1 [Acidobacteriota bacterium]MCA1627065.1 polyphosphate kinase 1 [Acidobacteriota bacterium]
MSTVVKREATVHEFTKPVEVAPRSRTELFLNRELSLLEFHARVLEEARDPQNPLLERLKFLSIFSSNLDEFFQIRVSGLKEEMEHEVDVSPDGRTPAQQLAETRERIVALVDEQARCLSDDVLPGLAQAGIPVVNYDSLSRNEKERLEEYFTEKVFPVLTPLAVDPSHPFPYISPLSVNICLIVNPPKNMKLITSRKLTDPNFVRIKVPSILPRLVPVSASSTRYVLLEEIIEANIHALFPNMEPGPCYRFRVTRDADIDIREEEAHDLLSAIKEELRQRRFGTPVRLEVSTNMPDEMIEYLTGSLHLERDDVYKFDGPVHVQDLMSLYDLDRPDLKDTPFTPQMPAWYNEHKNIFDAIRERDRLLHHPYDSYDSVTEFINEAVDDPEVVAIKICLYRTGPESPIPPALIRASEQGKQVTALIELKARFDEEHNIEWARKLDEAGVHVVYGIVGLKTHGKLTLVVRREGDALKRYVHIASGNYNPTTSTTYTDLGLFTVDDEIGRDATELFNYLTGFCEQRDYRKLMVAPVELRDKLNALFDREIEHKRGGRPARIIAKFNRLADLQIIDKLYEVSRAGVEVDLIIRGICVLRPGIPGLSENIRVRSVVGRFLEHSRVFWFANGGDEELYIGSADWMTRNLKHRIEVVAPVTDGKAKRYLRDVLLDAYLTDNTKARELQPDGRYTPVTTRSEPFNSQEYFIGRPCCD